VFRKERAEVEVGLHALSVKKQVQDITCPVKDAIGAGVCDLWLELGYADYEVHKIRSRSMSFDQWLHNWESSLINVDPDSQGTKHIYRGYRSRVLL
jgi:hypothetical protein